MVGNPCRDGCARRECEEYQRDAKKERRKSPEKNYNQIAVLYGVTQEEPNDSSCVALVGETKERGGTKQTFLWNVIEYLICLIRVNVEN